MHDAPRHLHLKREEGLSVQWQDGSSSFYPVAYLRRMSPSAEQRDLRERMAKNPLTVLPATSSKMSGPLIAETAELVGNYALRIHFSDGHDTGIFTLESLHEMGEQVAAP